MGSFCDGGLGPCLFILVRAVGNSENVSAGVRRRQPERPRHGDFRHNRGAVIPWGGPTDDKKRPVPGAPDRRPAKGLSLHADFLIEIRPVDSPTARNRPRSRRSAPRRLFHPKRGPPVLPVTEF